MMRNYVMAAVCSLALALSACSDTSESYTIGSSDAYSKLAGSGYSGGIYPLPNGLSAMKINLAFEATPTDQTAYWKFTRNGKELGRINAVVEGDATSSTISYSYAKGEGAGEDEKLERLVRTYMPKLISETIDAKIEDRAFDARIRNNADAMISVATIGNMMKDVGTSMDKYARESDERATESKARAAVNNARYNGAKPTTDLSKY
ncbi:MAG: hypothetical protein LH610_00250 [Sphingomonas bacterium]|nr:hypothetical protein [Sphingomonas bacterium]